VELCSKDYYMIILREHTYTYRFTDPLSAETGLNIELVMITAGLQYVIKSKQ
jgi:hypothetical protein